MERIYSSPYYRCLQTIEPFAKLRAQALHAAGDDAPTAASCFAVRAEAGLSEWYGSAPFEHPTSAPLARLKELFPRLLDESYAPAVVPPRQGETIAQLHDRIAAAAQAIIDRCDEEGVRAVLLCSHAAAIIALGRVLTGNMPESTEAEDFRAFTCGLTVYRRRPRQQRDQPAGGQGPTHPAAQAARTAASADITAPTTTASTTTPQQAPVEWKHGKGVRGGWVCETDCDCSFLSGGEERGWQVPSFLLFPFLDSLCSI